MVGQKEKGLRNIDYVDLSHERHSLYKMYI